MPSIETITTSDIVIPSRVATRDRRPVADTKLQPPAPPDVAVERIPEKVALRQPLGLYRVTDAAPLAALFGTSAPVKLDVDAVEDEIARILALLESDPTDAVPAEACATLPTADASASMMAVETPPDTSGAPASQSTSPPADSASTPLSIKFVDALPPSQAPASPIEVAARLASLIADHNSLVEEFAAATEHLGSADPADDASQQSLVTNDEHAPPPVEAQSAQPMVPSGDVASHEEVDVPPPANLSAPLPAWSSAAEASGTARRDPAVESLVRAIAAAQSWVPIAPPAPPPPAKSMHSVSRTDVDHLKPNGLPYMSTPVSEPARLNPVPGFLGGVAVSGIVGAALWAVLQA